MTTNLTKDVLIGNNILTETTWNNLSMEQQLILEGVVHNFFKGVSEKLEKLTANIKQFLSARLRDLYEKTLVMHHLVNMTIEVLDRKLILFYTQAKVQGINLGLPDKAKIAEKEIEELVEYRSFLLQQRVKPDSFTKVLSLFLKFSFVYPFKQFSFAKDFYKDISEEVIYNKRKCGETIKVGKMFQATIILKIVAFSGAVIAMLFSLFKKSAIVLAAQVALVASNMAVFAIVVVAVFTLVNIASAIISLFEPFQTLSYSIIVRCEDDSIDSYRQHLLITQIIKKSSDFIPEINKYKKTTSLFFSDLSDNPSEANILKEVKALKRKIFSENWLYSKETFKGGHKGKNKR